MEQDIMHKILSEHKELTSMPQIITEIINVSRNENSSSASLAKIIMKDPNLTTRILRVVNSPYYGSAKTVTTINQAVMTMGQRAVIALALAASIYNMVNEVNSAIDRKKFWRHSLEVAIAAKEIARAINYESPEEAFICGLLHDIGVLVLDASFPEESKKIWKLTETGESLLRLEEEYWGTNHSRVGQFLLRQWGLPELFSEAIGGHHLAFGPEDNLPYQRIILTVNLANRISRFNIGSVPPPSTEDIMLKKTLTADLGLSEKALGEIEVSLISDVVKESGFLEIEIGAPEEILQEANELIYQQYVVAERLVTENQSLKDDNTLEKCVDHNQDDMIKSTLSIFELSLKEVSKVIHNQSLMLKSAVEKGEISDSNSLISLSATTINECVDIINYLTDELKKYDCRRDNISKHLLEMRSKITEHIKVLEESTKCETV